MAAMRMARYRTEGMLTEVTFVHSIGIRDEGYLGVLPIRCRAIEKPRRGVETRLGPAVEPLCELGAGMAGASGSERGSADLLGLPAMENTRAGHGLIARSGVSDAPGGAPDAGLDAAMGKGGTFYSVAYGAPSWLRGKPISSWGR